MTEVKTPVPSAPAPNFPARFFRGFVAGVLSTVPMTIAMVTLDRLLPGSPPESLPPKKITRSVARAVGADEVLEKTGAIDVVTTAAHFGYGGAAGALYVAASSQGVSKESYDVNVPTGIAFCFGVWGVSYLGWLPAVGLHRSATQEWKARNVTMIAAHLVWGAALSAVYVRLAKQNRMDVV